MIKQMGGFQKIGDVLSQFDVEETHQRRISREWQDFAYRLAVDLGDTAHTAVYMRMAKNYPRALLEQARSFVMESNAKSKAKLFMWKIKQLRTEQDKIK